MAQDSVEFELWVEQILKASEECTTGGLEGKYFIQKVLKLAELEL